MIGNNHKGKVLGTRNGLKIRTKLKTNKPLKVKKQINKVSGKQAIKNKCWKKITDEKFESVGKICLWCGKHGSRKGDNPINGHHIERRNGRNNTSENCYPSHDWNCHQFITDNNVDCNIYHNAIEWNLAHPEKQFKIK
jgi:hypothetical protein